MVYSISVVYSIYIVTLVAFHRRGVAQVAGYTVNMVYTIPYIYGIHYIYMHQVLSRWEKYAGGYDTYSLEQVSSEFPFHPFFQDAPQPLFKGKSKESDWEIAEGCFRHIRRIFTQLDVRVTMNSQLVALMGLFSSFQFCLQ